MDGRGSRATTLALPGARYASCASICVVTGTMSESHATDDAPARRRSDHSPSGGPSLANVDAIFFLGHREIDLTAQQKSELLSFVKDDGKGFVGAHTATTAFLSWPEFADMIGGQYDDHPWGVTTAPVITEDPSFPATQHFPPVFTFTDEFYQTKAFSREKSRVLLRLDMSKLPQNPNVRIINGDFPLAWAKMYGKGRVFYSSLGHDANTWDNSDVYRMYFEAIKWALGLTNADITPRLLATAAGVQK